MLDAAFALFAERGYAGTTIAAIAEEAGVSPETIYLTVGGKRGVLEAVIELAISGDEEAPRTTRTSWWASVAELPVARDRLARMVEYSCAILGRTRPIHTVIRGAADKETFAAALGQPPPAGPPDRPDRAHPPPPWRRPERRGSRSPRHGQRYCALASPDLYHMVTVEFGWSAERHRSWLTELLVSELLGGRS